MSQSPFQRFIHELRRRHVPQTAAIYLVAAWAVIQFADVVVPNLNGPQWVVTAVIVASLVGFPVMLVLAWIFELGPGGIHRTDEGPGSATEPGAEAGPGVGPGSGRSEPGSAPAGARTEAGGARPWLAVAAILVVGIGSALGVAYVLRGEPESAAPTGPEGPPAVQGLAPGGAETPGVYRLGTELSDSVQAELLRSLGNFRALDSLDLTELMEIGRQAAAVAAGAGGAMAQGGVGILIIEPEAWSAGGGEGPAPLAEGDTLAVTGMAFDSTGIVEVRVDGKPVVALEEGEQRVRFRASLVGLESAGTRAVAIVARTADGREIRREYEIVQLPGGTP